jgi:hypothetical protein
MSQATRCLSTTPAKRSASLSAIQVWCTKLKSSSLCSVLPASLTLKPRGPRGHTVYLDLGPFLMEHGITPVLLHLLGSDLDDLAYLRDIETTLKPRHTAIILNEGMVPSGRSPLAPFEPVISHSVFKTSVDRGAKVLKMPRLGCMQEVDRRRLSFGDAQSGLVKAGQEPFPFTPRQMVAIWRREMATCMEPIRTWII